MRISLHISIALLLLLAGINDGQGQDYYDLVRWVRIAEKVDLPEQAAICLQDVHRRLSPTAMSSSWLGRLYVRAGRTTEAIEAFDARIDSLAPSDLLRLVILHAEDKRGLEKANGVYARLAQRFGSSSYSYAARAILLYANRATTEARTCIDSGLSLLPGNSVLTLAKYRFSLLDRDTVNLRFHVPGPDVMAAADVGTIIELGHLIAERASTSLAMRFLENAERWNRDRYPAQCQLAGLYQRAGMIEEETRVLVSIATADSASCRTLIGFGEPPVDQAVSRSTMHQVLARLNEHADALLRVSRLADAKGNYLLALRPMERYVSLPIVELQLDSLVLGKERVMILKYVSGQIREAQQVARDLAKQLSRMYDKDPLLYELLVHRAICYFVVDDIVGAESDLRTHSRRANDPKRRDGADLLRTFAARDINKPDVLSAINKFYGDLATPPTPTPVTVVAPTLLVRMALESFGESGKVNPESDKSFVHVRSLIPMLRFDSNRVIHKVDQTGTGDWELWLPAGTHILKLDAPGFQRLELPPMNFARKRSYEISIRKAAEE
jgi:tetratricopeptide (TPR) repeat protein